MLPHNRAAPAGGTRSPAGRTTKREQSDLPSNERLSP
jgi:hypothetical protein